MALSSNPPSANGATIVSKPNENVTTGDPPTAKDTLTSDTAAARSTPPKTSIDTTNTTTSSNHKFNGVDETAEFSGNVNTNDEIPSQATLKKIEDYSVLDKDGRTIPFKSLYTGPNTARRVLIIFIRHFFCGQCQEYLRSVTDSITEDSLLQLQTPTFIAIVGCGSPALIPMYQETTNCPFPIYADPTKRLYNELGMTRTLNLGTRPDYQRNGLFNGMVKSMVQSLKNVKNGMIFQGGDYQQVGGEFLFEPLNLATPISSPEIGDGNDENKQIGEGGTTNGLGSNLGNESGYAEEKRITWCHRMRNTRDHVEIPELREVLGLDGVGEPGTNNKRWSRALRERKGTGLSTASKLGSTSETGGSSGRQSSEKLMDSTKLVK